MSNTWKGRLFGTIPVATVVKETSEDKNIPVAVVIHKSN
jgi:hypothetical protein